MSTTCWVSFLHWQWSYVRHHTLLIVCTCTWYHSYNSNIHDTQFFCVYISMLHSISLSVLTCHPWPVQLATAQYLSDNQPERRGIIYIMKDNHKAQSQFIFNLICQNFNESFVSKTVVRFPVATPQVVHQHNINVCTKLPQTKQDHKFDNYINIIMFKCD